MVEYLNPNSSPEQLLDSLREESRRFNQAVVVLISVEDGSFGLTWKAANMKASEVIAMLEVTKARILREEMGI